MRMQRTFGLVAMLATLALVIGACTGASPSPSAPEQSADASVEESEAASAAPSAEPLRIGVVTDVGQLEDKSFNQSSNEGAMDAASELGGEHDVIVTEEISDYAQNIQTFVDQDFDVIVTVGFLITDATTIAAKENPDIFFIGVDQGPCVDENGDPDPTFTCAGDAAALLPNYQGVLFAEDQAGYLAGIVAANISESGTIGAVGGTNVPPVVAYHEGYANGAMSVNPDIEVLYQEVSPDPAVGFNDPERGQAIAEQFIGEGADVLFQIAGLTGQGVLEAACEADIFGIGVDVDQVNTLPNLAECIVTSAEKKLRDTVAAAIVSVAEGDFQAGGVRYDAASDPPAIGLAPYHEFEDLIDDEIQSQVQEAFDAMAAGELDPTP